MADTSMDHDGDVEDCSGASAHREHASTRCVTMPRYSTAKTSWAPTFADAHTHSRSETFAQPSCDRGAPIVTAATCFLSSVWSRAVTAGK